MNDWELPVDLPSDAADWWPEIVAELRRRGQLATALPLYARILAQLLTQYDKATTFLNREGMVLELRNDKGEVKRQEPAPEFRIQQTCIEKIVRLAKLLGLEESPLPTEAGPRNRLSELLQTFAATN